MTLVKKSNRLNFPEFLNTNEFELLHPLSYELDNIIKNVFPDIFSDKMITKGSYPKLDIVEYNDKVLIETEVPGLTKNDIKLCVKDEVLTISGGKRVSEKKSSDDGVYITRELKKSEFSRSVRLGDNIDKTKIDASFKDGILLITLPKIKEEEIKEEEINIQIK